MEPNEQPRLLKRRVATAPTLLQPRPSTPRSAEKVEGDVDTIFNHANAKVISLVALSDQTFSLESSNRDTIGPWQSHFERTIAIGSLRLYRAPGSVAFLSCGSALQPIFPKSQCWCMEEDGRKFILQIRPPSYWRIELASPSPPGNAKSLRECLESVLLLDKTPCPFKESVPILLPSESPPPKNRRPWKPLRSYPSEPILAREMGGVCRGDNLLFKRDRGDRGTIAECQDKCSHETAHEDYIDSLKFGPKAIPKNTPRSRIEDGANPRRPKVIDEPSLQIACMQNGSSPDARPRCMPDNATSDVDPGSTQPAQDLLAIPGTNRTDTLPQSNEEQPKEKPCLTISERGKVQRRYTIASSGKDAEELDGFVRKTNGGSVHSRGSHRHISTNTFTAHCQEMSAKTTRGAPSVESHHHHPPTPPSNAARLRLRRKELGDTTIIEAERQAGDAVETTASPSTTDASGQRQSDLLPEPIFLLFYTIFAVVMLVVKVIEAAVVNLRKSTRNGERRAQQSNRVPGRKMDGHDTRSHEMINSNIDNE